MENQRRVGPPQGLNTTPAKVPEFSKKGKFITHAWDPGFPATCLVTRIQGTKNNFDAVRQATKSLSEISPPYALMSALQGFLGAFDVTRMIGVSADQQTCSRKPGFVPEAYVHLYKRMVASDWLNF